MINNTVQVQTKCPACSSSSKLVKGNDTAWIACDECETWYHFSCLFNPLDDIETIDKWYCDDCLGRSATLVTTYKQPPRKTNRSTSHIDYKNLDAHLPADPERWMKVIETKTIIDNHIKSMKAEELTDEYIYSNDSMREPFYIIAPEGLGMRMPEATITVSDICNIVGPNTPIEIIDVASQTGLTWTLAQWSHYYNDANLKEKKIRNVISLEISNSPLSQQVIPPALCRKLDWVERFWPKAKVLQGDYPRVMKYCLMGTKGSYTDWHIDFFGSSVFYHVIRGSKIFYFIRPTGENLAEYEKWSSGNQQEWLGDTCDSVYKIMLTAGNTMIIPSGWIHCVYTPSDSLVFGGNFLSSLDVATQLKIYQIEISTKVPRKFRFPSSIQLHWYVANSYLAMLKSASPLSIELSSPRVLQGLEALTIFLLEQVGRFHNKSISAERKRLAKESASVVKDPVALVNELSRLIARHSAAHSLPQHSDKRRKLGSALQPTQHGPNSQFRNWAPPKGIASRTDDAEIVDRSSTPVVKEITREYRVDPSNLDDQEQRSAEVQTSKMSTSVVRRSIENGVVIIETRTINTTVERVCFTSPVLPHFATPPDVIAPPPISSS